ncbi:Uncharacterised protein [Vibrio cholerae]|nr:Uncharacterised protein [Vibrio cholerae]
MEQLSRTLKHGHLHIGLTIKLIVLCIGQFQCHFLLVQLLF